MSDKLKRKILDFFFPTRCPVCGELSGTFDRFCKDCKLKLHRYDGNYNVSRAVSFTATFVYDQSISPAIMLMKNGVCGNADYAFGNELADRLNEECVSDKIDIIIPVPMYRRDKKIRGFNQAELVAKVVGKRLGILVDSGSLAKIRRTKQQKSLDRKMRMVNVKGAYDVTVPEKIYGKRILLIDDICTTGSTLTELTALLLNNGASEVRCAACCKTPDLSEKKIPTV